jgi:replication factor A1
MTHPLVPGSIKEALLGERPPFLWVQLIFIKPMEGGRYKVAVSDSTHYIQSVVVSPMSQLLSSDQLKLNDVFKVTQYNLNSSKGHTFLVLGSLEMESLMGSQSKIGEPVNVDHDPDITPTGNAPVRATPSVAPPVVNSAPPVANSVSRPNPFQSNIGNATMTNRPAVAPPMGGGEEPESLQPIANLSPYHNRWAIKARIINKTDIKKFANAKGEGKLFSATCIDNSGEIRMTAFGDVVDKFFDMVQEGQVYFISNAQVKIAKRQFGVRNEYEIHLEQSSLISMAREGGEVLPSVRYSFIPISHVSNLDKDNNCDIIGIVREIGELANIVTKTTQKNLSKRDLTLVDTSNCSIKVTLWGQQAENFNNLGNYPIVAIKGARVSDYNGRTLSTSSMSTITMNPDIREAHELRGWFDSQGINESSRSLSTAANLATSTKKDDRKTVAQIKDEFLGSGDKPDFFSIMGTIAYVKSDATISYMACPTEGCNKKVFEEGPNMWRCEKCQKVFDRCDHRYIMSLQIGDHTGQTWVNAFNETGEQLLGKTAEEMYHLKINDDVAYSAVFKEAVFKPYLFRLRAKQESYQGEMKLRCNVLSAIPVNAEEESNLLIEQISKAI